VHYRYLTLEQRETLGRMLRSHHPDELPRLSTPDYGVCQACGADIPYIRLVEFPAARHCAACQPTS
jgi:RNA polymerase-binding transcription factor DksA